MPLAAFLLHQVLSDNVAGGLSKVESNASDVASLQNGTDNLATICAKSAVDLGGHCSVMPVNQ